MVEKSFSSTINNELQQPFLVRILYNPYKGIKSLNFMKIYEEKFGALIIGVKVEWFGGRSLSQSF